MKLLRSVFVLLFCAFLLLTNFCKAQAVQQIQLKSFNLQSSTQIKQNGKSLSNPAFHSTISWFKATVPSTVLTALVANKIYPDPYVGMNNMLIPDASDSFNSMYDLNKYSYLPNVKNPWKDPYWYRTHFKIDAKDKGATYQLIFNGINYRAEVWLNGHLIADSSQMVGMFAKYNFDVSKFINYGSENALAVKIYPLDFPGKPDSAQLKALGSFFLNGGPTGDIGKNVTELCTVGWDWVPAVRDRNMGIWQPIYLRKTGSVTFGQTKIATELPNLPDTNLAKIDLQFVLNNHCDKKVNGVIKVSILPENFNNQSVNSISFTQNVSVDPASAKTIKLNADNIKSLLIKNPVLWWPNGYGAPNLYRIKMQYINDRKVLDDTSFVFGIRTVSSSSSFVNGFARRYFYVNGKRIHLVGGAWVPDMLLNRDSTRYDYELHLCQNANLNLVRIWGGGITPPEPFWDAADRHGMLVWNDFWVTGDTQGEFKGSPDYPFQTDVFIRNMRSSILSIRNHPSLLVWTGGNEGHARKELYDAMRKSIIELDGTRPFIPSSSGYAKLPKDWPQAWPDNQPAGVYSGGPYHWEDPKEYFALADAQKDWVFKDETGIPSQPPLNTLKKVIPNLVWDTTLPFPLNNVWGYHDACTGAGMYDKYYQNMVVRYGQPMDIDSFSNKMQLMNATGYQAIFEAANSKINQTGGVMLWKLNAAFPSVIWQIYDWYLLPNAGYYFMKKACEPIHIQYDQNDSSVAVINRTRYASKVYLAEADIYSVNGDKEFHTSAKVANIASDNMALALSLKDYLSQNPGLHFIILNLKNQEGTLISKNIYWTAKGNDYQSLNKMRNSQVSTRLISKKEKDGQVIFTLQLKNISHQLAFFTRIQLMQEGEEVLPTFWSDNYISLTPGEIQDLTVSAPQSLLHNKAAEILISGWNISKRHLKVE
ncbi:MAG TPA: beta galactosidase jelly roll domain-containing protein [Arachidicoccus soli]|nr:beta galactosidase jelly roll domain-containing protein [Arachidicoccus soli]